VPSGETNRRADEIHAPRRAAILTDLVKSATRHCSEAAEWHEGALVESPSGHGLIAIRRPCDGGSRRWGKLVDAGRDERATAGAADHVLGTEAISTD
jgi:hypothetical protein